MRTCVRVRGSLPRLPQMEPAGTVDRRARAGVPVRHLLPGLRRRVRRRGRGNASPTAGRSAGVTFARAPAGRTRGPAGAQRVHGAAATAARASRPRAVGAARDAPLDAAGTAEKSPARVEKLRKCRHRCPRTSAGRRRLPGPGAIVVRERRAAEADRVELPSCRDACVIPASTPCTRTVLPPVTSRPSGGACPATARRPPQPTHAGRWLTSRPRQW
jgi:hypothetical protein